MYVKDEISHVLIVEKSRFITYLRHCTSDEEYRSFLAEIRKKHYDASHVCSAFLCGNIRRSSDDGEPAGTAGVPILSTLEKNGMDETCALVVRYFGGVKLGAGGLIRAYGSAVSGALKEAVLVEDIRLPLYRLALPYDVAHRIERFLENNTVSLTREYDTEVTFAFALEDEKILKKIEEYTKGIAPELTGIQVLQKVVS